MVQAYDARYRLVELRDGNGNATQFGYDSKGRMNLIRYPLAEGDEGYDTIRFPLHDDAGRVLRRIDGNDVVTDYEWNGPGGALSAIRYPAAPELDVEFAHDALGQVIGMSDATGEHEYERDDLGNLLSVTMTRGLPGLILERQAPSPASRPQADPQPGAAATPTLWRHAERSAFGFDRGATGALACQSATGRPAAGGGCDSNAMAGRLRAGGRTLRPGQRTRRRGQSLVFADEKEAQSPGFTPSPWVFPA